REGETSPRRPQRTQRNPPEQSPHDRPGLAVANEDGPVNAAGGDGLAVGGNAQADDGPAIAPSQPSDRQGGRPPTAGPPAAAQALLPQPGAVVIEELLQPEDVAVLVQLRGQVQIRQVQLAAELLLCRFGLLPALVRAQPGPALRLGGLEGLLAFRIGLLA